MSPALPEGHDADNFSGRAEHDARGCTLDLLCIGTYPSSARASELRFRERAENMVTCAVAACGAHFGGDAQRFFTYLFEHGQDDVAHFLLHPADCHTSVVAAAQQAWISVLPQRDAETVAGVLSAGTMWLEELLPGVDQKVFWGGWTTPLVPTWVREPRPREPP